MYYKTINMSACITVCQWVNMLLPRTHRKDILNPLKINRFQGIFFFGAQSGDQSNNKILNGFKDIYWKLIQEHPELTARQVWITTIRTLQTRLPFSKRTYWCGSWIKLSMGNGAESSMKCALLPRKFAKRVFILQVAWQVFHYLFVMN